MGDYTEHLISMAGGDGEPDLDQIQARADAATEGPWVTGWGGQEFYVAPKSAGNDIYQRVAEWTYAIMPGRSTDMDECATQDADFIAAARTDIPALLALVRSQQAQIERAMVLARNLDRLAPGDQHYAGLIRAALTATDAP